MGQGVQYRDWRPKACSTFSMETAGFMLLMVGLEWLEPLLGRTGGELNLGGVKFSTCKVVGQGLSGSAK